jgi:hypothetical protein
MALSPAAYVIGPLIFFSLPAFSQQLLMGRIRRKASQELLQSVSVINRTQKKSNLSDIGGNYKIPARQGDTIIFSSVGYRPDTAIIDNWMFGEKDGYQVYLEPNPQTLATVHVGEQSNYQLDSLKRKEEYAWLYPLHRRKLIGSETVTDGFGISMSPIDYFSAKEKQRRKLRRRLQEQEKDYYIDSRFVPAYVARVTGLKGDSLQVFLYRYRPSYAFCRKATSGEDILFYINDKLKEYRKSGK